MPFLERAGLGDGVEPFDFRVPGVTSISCDTVSNTFVEYPCVKYWLIGYSINMVSVPRDLQSSCTIHLIYVVTNTIFSQVGQEVYTLHQQWQVVDQVVSWLVLGQ